MSIADEKYISVTTFRRSGVAVSTPTWVVPLGDGRVGFWTSSSAGKAKRLRNNPRVTVAPSDARGRVKAASPPIEGHATLVDSGPDFELIRANIAAKYGVMVPISKVLNVLGHLGKGKHPYGDLGIVITLDA